jgi:hypothetical protein
MANRRQRGIDRNHVGTTLEDPFTDGAGTIARALTCNMDREIVKTEMALSLLPHGYRLGFDQPALAIGPDW